MLDYLSALLRSHPDMAATV